MAMPQSGGGASHASKPKSFHLLVNNQQYEWADRNITGAHIRQLAAINEDSDLFQKIKGSLSIIEDDQLVDLGVNGTEQFVTQSNPARNIVSIKVNGTAYDIHRGRRTVAEIEQVGKVPPGEELDQIIDGVITPLSNSGFVVIKGGEQFVSHVPDGGSS